MPPRNGRVSTRNSNHNKNKNKKGPPTAVPCAQQDHSPSNRIPKPNSPSRDDKLPLPNQNKDLPPMDQNKTTSSENVSELSFTFMDKDSPENETTPSKHHSNIIDNPRHDFSPACPATLTNSTPLRVSDNRGSPPPMNSHPSFNPAQQTMFCPQQPPADYFSSTPNDPWHLTYNELRTMRARMGTLQQVEAATLDFAKQLQTLTDRSTATEAKVSNNEQSIQELREELNSLKKTVNDQQQTIQNLKKVKEDFKKVSQKSVSEMNTLLEQQRNQVETFKVIRKDINTAVQTQKDDLKALETAQIKSQAHLKGQLKHVTEDFEHQKLKDLAYRKRRNIIIIGLPEQEGLTPFSTAITLFKNQLKLKKVEIETAYRIGRIPTEGDIYIRPLLVKFKNITDRNRVWKARNDIPQTDGNSRIKIQADLPKKLRDDINIIYRVLKAASSIEEFNSATVRDYAIVLHGKQYTANQLELLPPPIRPSSLAVRETDDVLVFFSRFCFLSNHHPSTFKLEDNTYQCMEQYLAFKKAEMAQRHDLMQRALRTGDPVEAKSILNMLRHGNSQDWEIAREDITIRGLRAKFEQNKHLAELLMDTRQITLGEASKDPCWGVGFTLDQPQILDNSNWNASGNLLGRALMRVRSELVGRYPPQE